MHIVVTLYLGIALGIAATLIFQHAARNTRANNQPKGDG